MIDNSSQSQLQRKVLWLIRTGVCDRFADLRRCLSSTPESEIESALIALLRARRIHFHPVLGHCKRDGLFFRGRKWLALHFATGVRTDFENVLRSAALRYSLGPFDGACLAPERIYG